MNRDFTILAIDTSCDETAVAVVQGRKVMANVLASQVELHRKYGGVYPIEAKRAHEEKIDDVVAEALSRYKILESRSMKYELRKQQKIQKSEAGSQKLEDVWKDVDAIAVTVGPGLAPALEVGIRKAKELARKYDKPLIAVNHMEGHLLSCLAQNSKGGGRSDVNKLPISKLQFPILGLLVSGGHTELVLVKAIGEYEIIGQTVDDAAGECLDKVARMLGLGYPGGAIIEELAKSAFNQASADKKSKAGSIDFPIPMKGKPGYDFSFSGLKTAALYEIRARKRGGDRTMPEGGDKMVNSIQWGEEELRREYIVDFCASIQSSVIESLVHKTERAIQEYSPSWLWLGGGVGANVELRKALRDMCGKYAINLGIPYSNQLWGDNAAMIGVAAYFKALRGEFVDDLKQVDRKPRKSLG